MAELTIEKLDGGYFLFTDSQEQKFGDTLPEAEQLKSNKVSFFTRRGTPLISDVKPVDVTTIIDGATRSDYTTAEDVIDTLKEAGMFYTQATV